MLEKPQDSTANCRPPGGREQGTPREQGAAVCSGHGVCGGSGGSGGDELGAAVCLCEGDWFGERCEHGAMLSERFLPATDPAVSAGRCLQARHRQQPVAPWLQKLESNSHVAACSPSSAFLQEFSGTRGLGITWRWLSLALSTAVLHGKTLVVGGTWPWFDFAGCDRGVWCYLEPLSNCSGALVREHLARVRAWRQAGSWGFAVEEYGEGELRHLHPDTQRQLAALARPSADSAAGMPAEEAHGGSEPAGPQAQDPSDCQSARDWALGLDLEGQVPQVAGCEGGLKWMILDGLERRVLLCASNPLCASEGFMW